MIRVERLRLDGAARDIQLPLLTSMYLGDRWEYLLFRTEGDDFPLRAWCCAMPNTAI